jgi:hypothetical protein
MDRPLLYLGLLASAAGSLLLFVIIPGQHIPPMMSTVSPDFYPNIGTTILLIGGIGLVISSLGSASKKVDIENFIQIVKFCCLMTALFSITLLAFYFINFLVGGIFLVFGSMWLLGERRPHVLLSVSLISPVLIWLFIDVLLGRSLP